VRLCSYLRVSTEKQADEDRYGIPRQRHEVAQFICRAAGEHSLVAEYVEVASGTHGIAGREAFPELLARLRNREFDGVVFSDLTRLSRSLTTQEALLAAMWGCRATIFSADGREVPKDDPDDPMRTAMRQMAGVFSQLERAMISKRLRDGRKAKARVTANYAWTFAPWGFVKIGSQLVVDETSPAWDTARFASSLRNEGQSLRTIARALEAARVPTATGCGVRWSPSQVSRLLARESSSRSGCDDVGVLAT
jgi:DNA invertase Pin-like site-specific DNA recombinase